MVNIESRPAWGARHANGDRNLSGLADEVFVHHTVTAQLAPSASVEQERAQMRVVEGVGQSRFGTGISYNVLVFPSGRAYEGVSFTRRGTHTGGRNSTTRSICFVGNYETHEPTPAQLATAAAIIAEGRGKWWKPGAPVRGHRDIKATSCPGRHVYAQLGALASGTVQVSNEVKPAPAPAPSGLAVDGQWGPSTTRALQRKFGTAVDGVISGQKRGAWNAGVNSAKWGSGGSQLIAAMQRWLGIPADGYLGPQTVRALQARMGTPVDGVISAQSQAVAEMQRRLNAGTL